MLGKKEVGLATGVFLSSISIGLAGSSQADDRSNNIIGYDKSNFSKITTSGQEKRDEVLEGIENLIDYKPLFASTTRFNTPYQVFLGRESEVEFSSYWTKELHLSENSKPEMDFSSERLGVITISKQGLVESGVEYENETSTDYSAAIRIAGITFDKEGVLSIFVIEYTGDEMFRFNTPGEIGVFILPNDKTVRDISKIDIKKIIQPGTINTIETSSGFGEGAEKLSIVDVNFIK